MKKPQSPSQELELFVNNQDKLEEKKPDSKALPTRVESQQIAFTYIHAWLSTNFSNIAEMKKSAWWGKKLTSGMRGGDGVRNVGLAIGQILEDKEQVSIQVRLDWEPGKGIHYNIHIINNKLRTALSYILYIRGTNDEEDQALVRRYYYMLTDRTIDRDGIPLDIAQDFLAKVVGSTTDEAQSYKATFDLGKPKSLGFKTYMKIWEAAKAVVSKEPASALSKS